MKHIRYQVKPEQVAENERLIGDVFRELDAKRPAGTRYLVLALPDGTFVQLPMGKSRRWNPIASFEPASTGDALKLLRRSTRR
jgi:hypothetical protein